MQKNHLVEDIKKESPQLSVGILTADMMNLGSEIKLLENKLIGKTDVTDMAIANVNSKKDSMIKDSGNEEGILGDCLLRIKEFVFNNRKTNAFLIAREESEHSAILLQIIRELADLRLIHLIDDNTSKAPSDGKRYEAYILDVGLYDNSRPTNFKQIQPGQRDERSRMDALRSSPVVSMRSIDESQKKEVLKKAKASKDELVLQEYYQFEMSFE